MDPRIRGPVRLKRSLTILMTRLRSFELNFQITGETGEIIDKDQLWEFCLCFLLQGDQEKTIVI